MKKHQYKGYEQENPKWLDELKKRIRKDYGPKCKSFCYGCGVCGAWLAYDLLVDCFAWKEKKESL